MIKLENLKMMDLLPSSISGDKTISSLASAIDSELQPVTEAIFKTLIIPNIDYLAEDLVDILAWQFNVDFYEPLGMDINKKRALVKNSINWHRRKGTKSVIEEMIAVLYTDKCKIEEWFEYGGEPYYFRIIVGDNHLSKNDIDNIVSIVLKLKNIRSWLESIIIQRTITNKYYTGTTIKATNSSFIPIMKSKNTYFLVNKYELNKIRILNKTKIPIKKAGV